MKKRTVGIYAPYDGSEQTFCAEYLAGYITRGYRYIKWFVPDSTDLKGRARGFSHKWDSEVVPWHGNLKTAKKIAAGCDTFVFFEPNEELFDRLPHAAVTALTVDPGNRTEPYLDFAKRCTFTLWPGERRMTEKQAGYALAWPFDPVVPLVASGRRDAGKEPRLFFPAFGLGLIERNFVEQIAAVVRHCRPKVKTVVGYYDATVAPKPGRDSRVYDWRLLRYLRNTDWIIDLNPRPLSCLFAAFAGGLEIPWMGYDIAPVSDEWNGARRHMITEPIRRIGSIDRIMPDLESTAMQIVDRLDTPFQSNLDRHHGSGHWDRRRTEFLRVTNIVLGNKTLF